MTPEASLELRAELVRFLEDTPRLLRMAQRQGSSSCAPLGCKHVPLYFAQRDGPFRQTAIRMKHRILRIFPSLMDEPSCRSATILHEAIVIEISCLVDPLQGQF